MELDRNVGISDTQVMNDDSQPAVGGPLFFPTATTAPGGYGAARLDDAHTPDSRTGAAAIQLDPVTIAAMTEVEVRRQVLEMLACLQRRPMAEVADGAAYTDGTPAIGSMTAVWVLSTIGKAFGRRLVRLSDVDRDSLRSIGGLARLIKEATARPAVAGAA